MMKIARYLLTTLAGLLLVRDCAAQPRFGNAPGNPGRPPMRFPPQSQPPRGGDGPWRHRVLLATSHDGLQWTVRPRSLAGRAFDPGGQALDPSVLKIGETWHIFSGGGSGPDRNWHGASRDGKTFTISGTMNFTAGGLSHMMANGLAMPGGYRFYGFNNSRAGQPHRIDSFFTRDGASWTADAGTRLSAGGLTELEMPGFGPLDPAIGRLKNGTYLMVYTTRIPGT